ncbi:MAG: head GIN domain-containing protein [Candidatus Zixiibacteriota bacterium]
MHWRKTVLVLAALAIASSTASPVRGDEYFGNWFGRMEKGSGKMQSEERDVGEFARIQTQISVDLHIVVGKPQSVVVTIDDNLLDNVKTRVRGGTLRITSRGSFSTRHNCKIEITIPSLAGVVSEGSGNISVENLSGERFEFTLAGSGNLTAEGHVDELDIELDGSGDIDTRELTAEDVTVTVNGSGDVKVHARKGLDGTINGSGDIGYVGEPEHVATRVYGSGSIQEI